MPYALQVMGRKAVGPGRVSVELFKIVRSGDMFLLQKLIYIVVSIGEGEGGEVVPEQQWEVLSTRCLFQRL